MLERESENREGKRESKIEWEGQMYIYVPINAYKLFKIIHIRKMWWTFSVSYYILKFHYFDEMHYVNSNNIILSNTWVYEPHLSK